MKLLQLGPYPPPHGGVQTNIVAIRSYLLERQIPCRVINLTRFRQNDADGIHYPQNALQVFRLLLALRYSIVHLHIGGSVKPRLLWLALFCCLLPRRRCVLTLHSGGYPFSKDGREARPWTFRGFVFRRFDRVIAVNQAIADMFRRFGVPSSRIRLIRPYAPVTALVGVSLPENIQHFMRTHTPLLLTVGQLEPEYCLRLQIEVLGLVREKYPNAGLMVAGSGSLEQDLHAFIKTRAYAEHVLLTGDLAHTATLRVMADSDLLLRPTLYDGDSIAVREALDLGTPVIASDNGMRPEGVDLVPVSDLAGLKQAIEGRLANPEPRTPRKAPDTCNLEAVLDLYKELAGAS